MHRTDNGLYKASEESNFEYETITLYKLDANNGISSFDYPFRLALNSYLN